MALRNELALPQMPASIQSSPARSQTGLAHALQHFLDKSAYYPGEGWAARAALAELRTKLPSTKALTANGPVGETVDAFDTSLVADLPIVEAAQALPRSALKTLHSLATDLGNQALSLQNVKTQVSRKPKLVGTTARIWIFIGLALVAMIFPLPVRRRDGQTSTTASQRPLVTIFSAGLDPTDATASRRAAAKHAFTTFLAILLLGPVVAGVGLHYASGSFSIPWAFLLISILCVVSFTHRIGAFSSVKKCLRSSEWWRPVVSFVGASILGALCFWASSFCLAKFFNIGDHFETGLLLAAASAPLLLLLAYVLMASAGMALLPFQASAQEWLNRVWGDTAIPVLGWLGIASLSLLWPEVARSLVEHLRNLPGSYQLPGATVLLGWILTTVSGVLSAYSAKTGAPAPTEADPIPWRVRVKQRTERYQVMSFLARISPYIFVLGLLILLSSVNHFLLEGSERLMSHQLGVWVRPEYLFLAVAVLLLLVLGRMIDVNRLSLHNVYRFRLIECYLAASAGPSAPTITMASLTAPAPLYHHSRISPLTPLRSRPEVAFFWQITQTQPALWPESIRLNRFCNSTRLTWV